MYISYSSNRAARLGSFGTLAGPGLDQKHRATTATRNVATARRPSAAAAPPSRPASSPPPQAPPATGEVRRGRGLCSWCAARGLRGHGARTCALAAACAAESPRNMASRSSSDESCMAACSVLSAPVESHASGSEAPQRASCEPIPLESAAGPAIGLSTTTARTSTSEAQESAANQRIQRWSVARFWRRRWRRLGPDDDAPTASVDILSETMVAASLSTARSIQSGVASSSSSSSSAPPCACMAAGAAAAI